MPYGNISAELLQEAKDAIKKILNEITEKQLNFLVNLTMKERQSLSKIGNNRYAFVKKFIQTAENNPDVFPKNFNLDELKKDFKLFDDLKEVEIPVSQLLEKLDDTRLAVSNEAYTKALQGRDYLTAANRDNAGLDAVVKELDEFFDKEGGIKEEGVPSAEPPAPPAPEK